MRSITSTLLAAQKATGATPFVRIVINGYNLGTTSGRLLSLVHTEEPYRESATIVIRNDDHYLSDKDLRGEHFEIGYGHITGEGEENTDTARLWVKSQHFVSFEGKLACILICGGMWSLLRELRMMILAEPPSEEIIYTDKTIYELIEMLVEQDNADFSLLGLGSQDDGIINDFMPAFTINTIPFENCATVLYRLIFMTKCYLRTEANTNFRIIYPQDGDSVDESYYSDKAHFFIDYTERSNLVIPNKILVLCNRDPVTGLYDPDIKGVAEDATSIALYDRVILQVHTAADITNQTDADNRAAAIMTKLKAEELAGRLIIPHDARMELYDRVAVYNRRGT